MNLRLLRHQEEGERFFEEKGGKVLFAWEMGTGKTVGSLYVMSKRCDRIVVLCTKSLKMQWRNEIIKFNIYNESDILVCEKKEQIKDLVRYKVIILNYEQINVFMDLIELFDYCFEYNIINKFIKRSVLYSAIKSVKDLLLLKDKVIEYEVMRSINSFIKVSNKVLDDKSLRIIEEFLSIKGFGLIIDEMFKVKNYKTNLSKSLKMFKSFLGVEKVIGLDGTPFYNNVLETYNIVNIVKDNVINWNEINRFFYKGRFGDVMFRNLDDFNRMLVSRVMHRVRKEDVRADLPGLSEKILFCDSGDRQNKVKELLLEEIGNLFEIYTVLRVLDSYYNYDLMLKVLSSNSKILDVLVVNKFNCELKNDEKNECLLGILEEVRGSKIIVFSSFANTVKFLGKFLNSAGFNDVGYVFGSMNDGMREDIINKFLNTDKINILLATDVLARGFNAVDVDFLVNYDVTPSFAVMQQRINRIHRINSKNGKVCFNMVGNVIESSIYKILKRKEIWFNSVVDGGMDRQISEKSIITEIAELWGIEAFSNKKKENIKI